MFNLNEDQAPVVVRRGEGGAEIEYRVLVSLYCVPVFLASLTLIGFQLLIIVALFSTSSGSPGPVGLGYGIGMMLPFVGVFAAMWFVGCRFVSSSIISARAYLIAGTTSLAIPAHIALMIFF